MPTLPPNVARPEDLKVVVVALVATRLLSQAVSETVWYVDEALVIVPLVAVIDVTVGLVEKEGAPALAMRTELDAPCAVARIVPFPLPKRTPLEVKV